MRTTCMIALAMYSCLAGRAVSAQVPEYSDDEVKAQFVEAGMFCHAEFIRRGNRRAFEMAGCDTNRYARILRELAVENTNETEWAIASLGTYKTPDSLPFLYSYATNAVYGAKALKSAFAIEGVTSNSLSVAQNYFSITNFFPLDSAGDRSKLCQSLIERVYSEPQLSDYRSIVFDMALYYNRFVNMTSPNCVDIELCEADTSYKYTKRRLTDLRLYEANVTGYFNGLQDTSESYQRRVLVYTYQTNYLANAINELVVYPEANLAD